MTPTPGSSLGPQVPPSRSTADLLRYYLPERDGRSSGERLQAIAGKALTDGTPRIERRLHAPLLPEERHDARSTLVVTGLRCTLLYKPDLDKGTGVVPLETRFGRFAYLRMRLALIDWERKTFGDRRPGRTRHPDLVDLVDYNDELDPATAVALEDVVASRERVEAWRGRAAALGLTLSTWISVTLDNDAMPGTTTSGVPALILDNTTSCTCANA